MSIFFSDIAFTHRQQYQFSISSALSFLDSWGNSKCSLPPESFLIYLLMDPVEGDNISEVYSTVIDTVKKQHGRQPQARHHQRQTRHTSEDQKSASEPLIRIIRSG